ncbi:unnamed protein product [Didymodactylos carnosus]|uniref:Uncharacterized protein n=1 Tax=Didymodactylos carnosus TaxID=1234261 RepID=A0A8S2HSV6_9BILA|nr:unnamed protein product [Didymodactylos carnosus]CAF3675142.1 unnamed protein product [Didymodactylos carnosus]
MPNKILVRYLNMKTKQQEGKDYNIDLTNDGRLNINLLMELFDLKVVFMCDSSCERHDVLVPDLDGMSIRPFKRAEIVRLSVSAYEAVINITGPKKVLLLTIIIAIGFSYFPLFIAKLSSNRDLLILNDSSLLNDHVSTTRSLSLLRTEHIFFPTTSSKSYYEQHSSSQKFKQQNDLQIQQQETQQYFAGNLRIEAEATLHLALRLVVEDKLDKARRLFEHSLTLDLRNIGGIWTIP